MTSTETNPVAVGAVTYTSFYNGLLDGPTFSKGSFLGTPASWDHVAFHQYPTYSFGFSQSRFTFYTPIEPIGAALARLARIINGNSTLGT